MQEGRKTRLAQAQWPAAPKAASPALTPAQAERCRRKLRGHGTVCVIYAVVQALPVLAVVLVAFSGGLTERARQVVQTATVILAVAFVLSLISLAGAAGTHLRPGTWFILEAAGLAITATALIFTGAVMWSRPLRSLAPRFHDLGDDEEGFAHD